MDSSSWIGVSFSSSGPTGYIGLTGYSGVTGYTGYAYSDFENCRKVLIEAMNIIVESESIEIRKENYNVDIQEKGQVERIERRI